MILLKFWNPFSTVFLPKLTDNKNTQKWESSFYVQLLTCFNFNFQVCQSSRWTRCMGLRWDCGRCQFQGIYFKSKLIFNFQNYFFSLLFSVKKSVLFSLWLVSQPNPVIFNPDWHGGQNCGVWSLGWSRTFHRYYFLERRKRIRYVCFIFLFPFYFFSLLFRTLENMTFFPIKLGLLYALLQNYHFINVLAPPPQKNFLHLKIWKISAYLENILIISFVRWWRGAWKVRRRLWHSRHQPCFLRRTYSDWSWKMVHGSCTYSWWKFRERKLRPGEVDHRRGHRVWIQGIFFVLIVLSFFSPSFYSAQMNEHPATQILSLFLLP